MEMRMDSRKSIRSLAATINSLLGLKTHLTTSWVDTVCNISIKSSPPSEQEGPFLDHDYKNDCNDDADTGPAILKIQDELAALTAHIYQLNIQRRQVLNDFLDLKGNIRVFCRVRPIPMGENFSRLISVAALDSSSLKLNFAENKSKIYSFDKVFHPGSSQDEVFEEIEPVIKSALDGYNACIFAYGQTGTGKTFTMEGTSDHPGIIPRAIEALFKQAADSNHTFLFSFSMLEIYMGYLKDLLVPRTAKATDHMPPCLSIRTDSKGETEIDNLVTIQVSHFNHAERLYRLGSRFRSTASTNSNKSSSRSHCMTRILMTCFDANERRRITNKIWMVDLGGSERVLKTKAWGRRFEEGKAINLSLSALGDVINALHRRNCHIPYRNSKLTQVLKDSLGEDSKTLMLVHISPKEEDLCETVCSLNFATRARSIHLGNEELNEEAKAQREVEMTRLQQRMKWIEDKRQEVRREIQKLNEKLEDLTGTSPSSSNQLEVSHLSFELEVPQSNIETAKKNGIITAAPSSKLPRFMRPTICSRRKSGVDRQTSAENNPVPARKRRPSSHHAESVTLPLKGASEYNSDSNISRTSYLVGSVIQSNSESETEGSQYKSECDIKTVVLPIQDKLSRSPYHKKAQPRSTEINGNTKTNYLNSPKFIKVDDWLHLHKHEYGTSIRTRRSKRVPAIPKPEKNIGGCRWGELEKLHDDKVCDELKLLGEVGATGRSRSEVVTDVMPTVFKYFCNEDSPSNSISTTHTNDGTLMIKEQGTVEDFFIEEYVCSTSTPPDKQCGVVKGKMVQSGVNRMPMELMKKEMKFPEALMINNSWTSIHSASDVSGTITAEIDDFGVSISKSPCHDVTTEICKPSEEGKMHLSSQHSEAGKLQYQNLLPDKANQVDLAMPIFQPQGETKNTGICSLLKQKIQMLCNCALLGLGFKSLGLEHDFFYALML